MEKKCGNGLNVGVILSSLYFYCNSNQSAKIMEKIMHIVFIGSEAANFITF